MATSKPKMGAIWLWQSGQYRLSLHIKFYL